MITFGSLFAGIGGIDLGLERAGMTCAWQVEIDDYCNRVLAKHWPDVERFGDVRKIGEHNLKTVDLIAGGFPCQPVSLAGKRRGQEDDRWLWSEFERIICMVRPRYVLVENVPGLLFRGMGDVLRSLARSGYDVEWQSLPAVAFNAPHIRDRIFIVAYSQCLTNNKYMEVGGIFSKWKGLPRERSQDWIELVLDVGDVAPSKWESSRSGIDTRSLLVRNNNGVSPGMDRLRGLGNAVVPQVAEWIGKRIIEFDKERIGS